MTETAETRVTRYDHPPEGAEIITPEQWRRERMWGAGHEDHDLLVHRASGAQARFAFAGEGEVEQARAEAEAALAELVAYEEEHAGERT